MMNDTTKTLSKVNEESVATTTNQDAVANTQPTKPRKRYIPRVNIYEANSDIHIVADMPGIDENSVELSLEKNILTLQGHVASLTPDNYTLAYTEYHEGDYYRQFTLSNEIDQEKIEATVSNGVLRLRLPKAEQAKTRKILVRAG